MRRALGLLPLPVSRGPRDACVAGWLNGERVGVIGVNITHLPVAVVLFEHLSKLSRRSAN